MIWIIQSGADCFAYQSSIIIFLIKKDGNILIRHSLKSGKYFKNPGLNYPAIHVLCNVLFAGKRFFGIVSLPGMC